MPECPTNTHEITETNFSTDLPKIAAININQLRLCWPSKIFTTHFVRTNTKYNGHSNWLLECIHN